MEAVGAALPELDHLVGQAEAAPEVGQGELAVLAGVREFPTRVKCASLAWHTLKSAITNPAEVAKTE